MSYTPKELRLYTFVNFYLSSIQQGIQSAHIVSDLFHEYRSHRGKSRKMLDDWAAYGKTIIVLNGGMAKDVVEGVDAIDAATQKAYPYTAFYEEPGAIDHERGSVTAWGIVLPQEVYNAKPIEVFPNKTGFRYESDSTSSDSTSLTWEPGSVEFVICSYLQGKSLAR